MEAQGSELVTMELGTTEAADLFNAVWIYMLHLGLNIFVWDQGGGLVKGGKIRMVHGMVE